MTDATAIRAGIAETIEHLKRGDLDQAEIQIDIVDIDRLLRVVRDPSKGSRQFIDPAESFGRARVQETSGHLHHAKAYMRSGGISAALLEAEAALRRWDAGQ